MKLLLFIIIFLLNHKGYTQEKPLEEYYLGSSIKKKNKVKAVKYIDSSFPSLNTITEYDSLGREALWYYTNSETKTHSKYSFHKDTLIVVQFTSTKDVEKDPHEVNKYMYNKDGKISLFISARISFINGKTEAYLVKFYYGSRNELTSVLYYFNNNYPYRVAENIPIKDSLFQLRNVESFEFKNNSQLMICKQMIGKKDERYIDSSFYDSRKRLIRHTRFQKEGFVGEMRHGNILYTSEFLYSDSSILELKKTQYMNAFKQTHTIIEGIYESINKNNGLVDRNYLKSEKGQILSGRFEYIYYQP